MANGRPRGPELRSRTHPFRVRFSVPRAAAGPYSAAVLTFFAVRFAPARLTPRTLRAPARFARTDSRLPASRSRAATRKRVRLRRTGPRRRDRGARSGENAKTRKVHPAGRVRLQSTGGRRADAPESLNFRARTTNPDRKVQVAARGECVFAHEQLSSEPTTCTLRSGREVGAKNGPPN